MPLHRGGNKPPPAGVSISWVGSASAGLCSGPGPATAGPARARRQAHQSCHQMMPKWMQPGVAACFLPCVAPSRSTMNTWLTPSSCVRSAGAQRPAQAGPGAAGECQALGSPGGQRIRHRSGAGHTHKPCFQPLLDHLQFSISSRQATRQPATILSPSCRREVDGWRRERVHRPLRKA